MMPCPLLSISAWSECIAVDLFDYGGVECGHCSPARQSLAAAYIEAINRPFVALTGRDTAFIPIAAADQLQFDFMFPTRPVVVKLAPRSSHVYLDYGVYDMFRGVPALRAVARQFEDEEVFVLGQLVQLSEERLRAYAFITDDVLSQLRQQLKPLGLDLEMRIPSWYRRFKHLLKVCP